jgi:predicted DsbA family dithiol-disulfide isomerase
MNEYLHEDERRRVLHWYDFACPFSYVGQSRNALLIEAGFEVVPLPFQAHPGMPRGGLPVKPGRGPGYSVLEQEARAVGLALRWPRRIPHTRRALAAAEWVRRNQPAVFPEFQRSLFEAHFVDGDDIDDQAVIDRHAGATGVDARSLHFALADGTAVGAVSQAEWIGRQLGLDGTPAWLVDGRLMIGLQPASAFQLLTPVTVRVGR